MVRWLLTHFQELRKSLLNEDILLLSDWLRKWTSCGAFMAHTSYQQNHKLCITRNEVIGNEQENTRTTNLSAAPFEARTMTGGDSFLHPLQLIRVYIQSWATHRSLCVWLYISSGCWKLFCKQYPYVRLTNGPWGLWSIWVASLGVPYYLEIQSWGQWEVWKVRIRLQELE